MKSGEASGLAELRRRAEAGEADAQYELGCMYYEGKSVARDYAEALKRLGEKD